MLVSEKAYKINRKVLKWKNEDGELSTWDPIPRGGIPGNAYKTNRRSKEMGKRRLRSGNMRLNSRGGIPEKAYKTNRKCWEWKNEEGELSTWDSIPGGEGIPGNAYKTNRKSPEMGKRRLRNGNMIPNSRGGFLTRLMKPIEHG